MKTKNDIDQKVQKTFDSIDSIKDINVSPFFKDKTMQLLFAQKEEVQQIAWSWFSPKLQLATLVCVVIINVLAFTQLNKTNYDENLNQFAETYGLSINDDTSLLN